MQVFVHGCPEAVHSVVMGCLRAVLTGCSFCLPRPVLMYGPLNRLQHGLPACSALAPSIAKQRWPAKISVAHVLT